MYLRLRYYTRRLKLRAWECASRNRKEWNVRASIRASVGLPSTKSNPSLFAGRIRESCEILTRVAALPAKFVRQIFNTRLRRHYLNSSYTRRCCTPRGCRDIRIEFYSGLFVQSFAQRAELRYPSRAFFDCTSELIFHSRNGRYRIKMFIVISFFLQC